MNIVIEKNGTREYVLIETLWNVNLEPVLSLPCRMRINRNIVECKFLRCTLLILLEMPY